MGRQFINYEESRANNVSKIFDSLGQFFVERCVQKMQHCVLDTVVEVCLMPTSCMDGFWLPQTTTRLLAVNGTELEVSGQLQQSAIVNKHRTAATFLVSPSLGIGWLTENSVTWSFGETHSSWLANELSCERNL